MDKLFYVQKEGTWAGNSMLWWKKGGAGYSPDIKEARMFSEAEAKKICDGFNTDKKMWPKKYIDERIEHHIDMQGCDYRDAYNDQI